MFLRVIRVSVVSISLKSNFGILLLLFLLLSPCTFSKNPFSFSKQYVYNDSLKFLEPSSVENKSRTHLLNYSVAGMYGLSMTWLYTQWYRDYPGSSFHFFDDNREWELMDKYGHLWDAYNISKPLMKCYSWSGYDEKKATLFGTGITFLFLTTVETFDGFSEQWGFSGGDMLANAGGLALFAGQQLTWHEQRIVLKYSFNQTKFSQYNPKLLGSKLPENILKDYNGLTYWLTVNPRSFFKTSSFPKWLSIAIGFGAEGMTGGDINPKTVDGKSIPAFERYRQYYLSIDFDLARIETKSRFLNSVFKLINVIHLPAPAIEWGSGRKVIYRGMYF